MTATSAKSRNPCRLAFRSPRAYLAVVLVACSFLTSASRARAQLAILAPTGSVDIEFEEQRVAVALSTAPTTWLSVRFADGVSKSALVVAVPAMAALDFSGDRWLDALDAATAPRITPPEGGALCAADSGTAGAIDDLRRPWGGEIVAPVEVARLASFAELLAWTENRQYQLSETDLAALSAASGSHFVVAAFENAARAATMALRWTAADDDATFSLFLLPGVVTTLWLIDDRATVLADASVAVAPALGTLWLTSQGHSDYAERRSELINDIDGPWIVEAAGSDALFNGQLLPDGAGIIAPVDQTYGSSDQSDEADDLMLALAGLEPDKAHIVRITGIADGLMQSFEPWLDGTVPSGFRADDVDGSHCPAQPQGTVPEPSQPSSGSGTSAPYPRAEPEPDVVIFVPEERDDGTASGDSCSRDSASSRESDDGCSGDSSSSHDSADGCSGDSSSSSESGDGCSGDSSSSSESGDGCSGDSSSSSDSGDGCSTDSSSSSGSGDGCSGDASSSSSEGCSGDGSAQTNGEGRRRLSIRPRASTLTYTMAAFVLPLRRARRTRRRPTTGAGR